jgi:hypothetical protein
MVARDPALSPASLPFSSNAPGNDPHPPHGSSYSPSKDNGDVWGPVINIRIFSASGRGSDDLRNFDEVGT